MNIPISLDIYYLVLGTTEHLCIYLSIYEIYNIILCHCYLNTPLLPFTFQ